MEENKENKLKEYLLIAVVGIASGAIGSMLAPGLSSNNQVPQSGQGAVVAQQKQELPKLEQPAPTKPTPAPQKQETAPQERKTANSEPLQIATIQYEMIISEHPLMQQAHEFMRKDFEEQQKIIEKLPEKDRNDAWQKHNDEVMKKVREEYFDVAEKQIKDAVNQVLDQKGLKACLANTQLISGGIDITEEVKAILDAKK